MMRLYIRNKVKYDPLNSGKALIFVDFPDPRGFSVGQVKEEFKKKATAAKVDSLYHRQDDGSYKVLADDRTVGFYNIQDNAILETTSNPLWAAAIYYRLREVERDVANQPDDARSRRGLEQSSIQKYMALGILFNGGNNPEQQQPPYFEQLDQLYEYLQTAGKKPVHMSQKTLDTLRALQDEYEQNDVQEQDSIGQFVDRQAVKLGLKSKSSGNGDEQDRSNKGKGMNTGHMYGGTTRGNRETDDSSRQGKTGHSRIRKRVIQKQRTCEDCEEKQATQFCSDCQPPLVLCDDCAVVLHRGATRKNHHLKDVSQAPTPARNKGYTPKAYRAPFALLVAFHRAANEIPSKMSLTADELKSRAQPLTNTDLEIKQGRWFGGFDSLENTLVKNELVQKEARTPKYSLLEKGLPLAARCSEFDYAVQNLTQAASVPTIPVAGLRPVLENRQVCLLVDSQEPLRERFVRVARQRGLSAKTRTLPVGDFLWVLLPSGANPDTVRDMPDQELVLPMLVERKTWDDLWSSLKTTRFVNQIQRMKTCGLQNLFYLVEGSSKELKGNPGPEVETYLKDKIDSLLLVEQFLVNRTGSWMKTVEWLCHLTSMSIEFLQTEGGSTLTTYSEFSRRGRSKTLLKRTGCLPATTSAVWSASEFTDAIRSHSRGGNELRDLPISGTEERSLIVIQGLTLYNKQCQKLLDKALTDLLENTREAAEACVQRHLQGVTDQLIHQDVMQWYILWLQVFKGVIVRRTETEEESADILSKFSQETPGGIVAPRCENGEVDCPNEESEEHWKRLPDDDLIFASDSQEEDAMIRQALKASKCGDNASSREAFHLPRSTEKAAAPTDTPHGGLNLTPVSGMNEKEQLELALALSKEENIPSEPLTSSQDLSLGLYPHVAAATNLDVSSSTHSVVHNHKTEDSRTDDELEKALKLSLEEFESSKHRQHRKHNRAGKEDDLDKALELSKMEYEQFKQGSQSCTMERQGVTFDEDTELREVLKLSKLESELREREQHLGKPALGQDVLPKASRLSNVSLKQPKTESLVSTKFPPSSVAQDADDDLGNASERSKLGFNGKQQGIGDELKTVLELRRIGQPSTGGLDKNCQHLDSNVIVLEDCDDSMQSRDHNVTNENRSPVLLDDDSHGLSNDWDVESGNCDTDVFEASGVTTDTGSCKESAILLDSQEPIDDTANDLTYALKVQEELNKEFNKTSSNYEAPSTKTDTTCMDLNKQLVDYRKLQKGKYHVMSGRKEKSSPGLDFRRNVAAIACGKPIEIGIADPAISCGRLDGSGRIHGHPAVSSSSGDHEWPVSTQNLPPSRAQTQSFTRDPEGCISAVSSSRSYDKSFPTPVGTSSSTRPSSSSSFERVHKSPEPPSVSPSSVSRSNSERSVGPKCGACGEVGHNKNSKICPNYFSAEAVQRREEQSRKRKAKREEEEKEFNDRLGAMAAQRLSIEEQTRILGEQLDQLRRQSQSMADTQKKVEDTIKRRKKR